MEALLLAVGELDLALTASGTTPGDPVVSVAVKVGNVAASLGGQATEGLGVIGASAREERERLITQSLMELERHLADARSSLYALSLDAGAVQLEEIDLNPFTTSSAGLVPALRKLRILLVEIVALADSLDGPRS